MKKCLVLMLAPVLAGCLSASSPTIVKWPLGYEDGGTVASTPKYGVVRVLQTAVRAPYGELGIVVMRPNGSVAVDHYNEYAALPSQMMRGVAYDALSASGLFRSVVGPGSSVTAPYAVEVTVTSLALDCRTEGERKAVAKLMVTLVRDREIVDQVVGEGSCDAADGRYGAAFSKALSVAMVSALGRLR